jgi:hypothetical protein
MQDSTAQGIRPLPHLPEVLEAIFALLDSTVPMALLFPFPVQSDNTVARMDSALQLAIALPAICV